MDGRRGKKAKGQAEGAFEVIHILSDTNRIQILRLLAEQGELCARDILANFPITQPTLSHHMNVLLENHLVDARKSGRWVFYSISLNAIQEIIDFFESLRTVPSAQPEPVAAAGTSAVEKVPENMPSIAVRRKNVPLTPKRTSGEAGHAAGKADEIRVEPLKEKKEKKEKKKDKQEKKEKKKKKNKKKEK